jgi:hypothetical protein
MECWIRTRMSPVAGVRFQREYNSGTHSGVNAWAIRPADVRYAAFTRFGRGRPQPRELFYCVSPSPAGRRRYYGATPESAHSSTHPRLLRADSTRLSSVSTIARSRL